MAQALANNAAVHAAAARVRAAQARIGPAGARPDPMLMASVQNLPLRQPGYADFMTMNMVGISQTIPYPGKLSLAEQAAREEVGAATAALAQARLDAVADVKTAYYELAFARSATRVVRQNEAVLGSLVGVSEARYGVGTASQADVLRARVDAARLGDDAAALAAQERSALARLNAALNRPSTTPVDSAVIPARLARLAVADSAAQVHFVSAALGAAAADSPLLPLDSLDALAARNSPMLRSREAEIAAQAQRVALTRKARLPDFDVSVQYGQRPQFPDMVSLSVAVPLPLQHRRKQDQATVESEATLAALEAERSATVDTLHQQIATLVSDIERERTQLALSVRAVLPQARATLSSALASYQVGSVDFPAVTDAQASVFTYETTYFRALTDFATSVAQLERVVGTEVLR